MDHFVHGRLVFHGAHSEYDNALTLSGRLRGEVDKTSQETSDQKRLIGRTKAIIDELRKRVICLGQNLNTTRRRLNG